MTQEQREAEKAFFADVWRFRLKYYDTRQDESFFKGMADDVTALERKYTSPFQRDLLVALVADIERQARGK